MNPAANPQAAPAVLVIDDDEIMRELMADWLEAAGYRVVKAADCDHAMEQVKLHQPAGSHVLFHRRSGHEAPPTAGQEQAIPLYEQVLRADPGRVVAAVNLGSALIERGQVARAIGLWKDARSVRRGQTADVIGMEVHDQHDVDFIRRVACAAEAPRQAPECSPTPPGVGARASF